MNFVRVKVLPVDANFEQKEGKIESEVLFNINFLEAVKECPEHNCFYIEVTDGSFFGHFLGTNGLPIKSIIKVLKLLNGEGLA